MVSNAYIKCQVCGSITRVRLQVGWQEKHPIVIACGKCRTSLSGYVEMGQDRPRLDFRFDNADSVEPSDADYMVECSGEFPTYKQCVAPDSEEVLISPFIRYTNCMLTDDSYNEFADAVSKLNSTERMWKSYSRILDLYTNRSEYLIQEIHKEFPADKFSCRDEFEVLQAVHMIEVHGFYSALKEEIVKSPSFGGDIMKMNPVQIKALLDFLSTHDGFHLDELQGLINKIYSEFVEVYQRLIPALSLQYCKDDSYDFDSEGSTTSSFDGVKQFYLDVYEALGNVLIIPISLDNLKYRSDICSMNPIEKDVSTLEEFIKLAKASRYHFCGINEHFTDSLGIITNAKLRNAIGHNDVEYDAINQLITYIPNPKDRTKKKTEYLLQFENEALRMFQGVLGISEYLYQLRKLELIHEGKIPIRYKNQ